MYKHNNKLPSPCPLENITLLRHWTKTS